MTNNKNRQMNEKKNFKRSNTPKITSISNRYYNITPSKTFSNNSNTINNSSAVTYYYSKYVRRNNSGVSINKMIDRNRNYSAGKKNYKKINKLQKKII